MKDFGVHILCPQEVDVNVHSKDSFIGLFRAHKLHAFLGGLDGDVHRTAVVSVFPGRVLQLQGIGDLSRHGDFCLWACG